jgi:hypothetical protein
LNRKAGRQGAEKFEQEGGEAEGENRENGTGSREAEAVNIF